jgi:Ca2+-binding RTX toxin-like protein
MSAKDLWLGARGWQSGLGNALDNYIDGNDYDNFINGLDGRDELWGERGDDGILGGDGDDDIYAGNGADVVRGQVGRDFLAGGLGADTMIGGGGRDIFDYNSATVSPPTARDIVRGGDGAVAFQNPGNAIGDLFDLSGIDANRATPNNDAFIFGGSGVGHLRLDDAGVYTMVRGDIEAGGGWELAFLIEDGAQALASDYTAQDFIL